MSEKKPSFILPQFKRFEKEYNEAVQCNRCGFCETVCPTYMATGKETLSPRGRNQAFRNILEGSLKDPKAANDIFSTCLTCHACTNVCFAQVPVGRIMGAAKEISQPEFKNEIATALFNIFLFKRRILSIFLWLVFLFKKTRILKFLHKIGILKRISSSLDAAEELVPNVSLNFRIGRPSQSSSKTAFFSGCGTHYLYPEVSRSILEILQRKKMGVQCSSHSCCGLIPESAGDSKTAKELAEKNIRDFSKKKIDTLLVNDDSCAGFMKSYASLLPENTQAKEFSDKVKNFSEFLIERDFTLPEREDLRSHPLKVTYHDPCQMGNGQKSFSSPREIIKRFSGVKFVELEESDWCCGGAGNYSLKHPDLADNILERKMDHIQASGAYQVITQASSCLLHVGLGIRRRKLKNVRVIHLAEFLKTMWSSILITVLGFGAVALASDPVPISTKVVSVLVTGDVLPESSWGVSFSSATRLFEHVQSEFMNANIVFINMEEPITLYDQVTPHKDPESVAKGRDFVFRATNLELPKIFKDSGIYAVNLANNHMMDYQAQGLLDTLEGLESIGLNPVGAGRNAEEAYRAIKIEEGGQKIALLGFSDVHAAGFPATKTEPGIASSKNLSMTLEAVEEASEWADHVVVMMHWGRHATYQVTARQRYVGKMLVESGADAVIGMHAHYLQGIEMVQDRPVFYGLGNFAFPGSKRKTRETVLVKLLLEKGKKPTVRLIPVAVSRQGQPWVVDKRLMGKKILSNLNRLCARFKTKVSKGELSLVGGRTRLNRP